MGTKKTLDLLNKAVFFAIEVRAFRNSRKATVRNIDTEADRAWLSQRKKLIDSPEYDAVLRFQGEIQNWCRSWSNYSYLRKGIYIVPLSLVEKFETKLREANRDLREKYLPPFLAAYPDQVTKARESLADLYNDSDYPSVSVMAARFAIDWQWIYLGVPDTLPPDVKQKEVEKLQKAFADAQDEIVAALRAGFSELIDHALDRLTPGPNGKTKKFSAASLVENFDEFFETFAAKNLMEDKALAEIVEKARKVMSVVEKPEDLKDKKGVSKQIVRYFSEIKKEVDVLVEEKPSRKFDLDD